MTPSQPPARESEIAAAVASKAREVGAIGMRAAVRSRASPTEFAAYGIDARNPDVEMKTTGRFRIASVTKTFTAALVLDLVDRGAVGLRDSIDRWLPTYPHASQISVESLLTCTSGTADMTTDAFADFAALLFADLSRVFTPDEIIACNAALAPFAAPGHSYRYSNTDYMILGFVAERISGASYDVLLRRHFTERLGLRDTGYDHGIPDDVAHGWFDLDLDGTHDAPAPDLDIRDFPNEALVSTAFAAGGMTSSLADLVTWGESLYLGDALSPAMRSQLLASPTVEDPASGRWHGYGVVGYGDRLPDGTWPAYGHAGNLPGTSAFVASFPRTGTTVAVHANVQEVPTETFIALAFELAGNA